MKNNHGFTLAEMLITVAVLGVVATFLAPVFGQLQTAQQRARDEVQKSNNRLIGNALLSFAANSGGRLPTSYSGAGYTATIYNPADASPVGLALASELTQTGVNPLEINDDGTAAQNVRVYQVVQGLQSQTPLFGASGAQVTLTYDFGVIYLTECSKSATSCNPSPSGVPGASPVLTAANYKTWAQAGTDSSATFISSLPLQKALLEKTAERLNKLRDALLTNFRTRQLTGAGGDLTNWYLNQAGVAAPGTKAGANPATNQGCRDGWYALNSSTVDVLPAVGLGREEFGVTGWGGVVEFCRDYDPTGTSLPNQPPHYAAVRFLSDVTAGGTPDPVVLTNNVVLTF